MIYQYKRDDGTIFEIDQPMSDDPLMTCPETGQGCRRLITGGNGAMLPRERSVKYVDGNMISRKMANALEANPLTTTLEDKRKRIDAQNEKIKNKKANALKDIYGRTTGLGNTGL